MAELRVVCGAVEVCGAVLKPSLTYTRVAVTEWAALLRMRALGREQEDENDDGLVENEGPDDVKYLQDDSGNGLVKNESPDVIKYLQDHPWPVLVCIRFLSQHSSLQDALETEDDVAFKKLVGYTTLLAPLDKPRLQIHKAWNSLVERFFEVVEEATAAEPPTFLVMGAKNVGKSTCCRYFVNSLLNLCSEVFFLETDIGQPELATPGTVALHRIRRPLLQPQGAEQHLHECVVSYYLGFTTPAGHPELYARSVKAAYDRYCNLLLDCHGVDKKAPPPLLVNTHGWVAGLGVELTRSIIAVTKPQLLLHIKGFKKFGHFVAKREGPEGENNPPAKRRRSALARTGPLALALDDAADAEVTAGHSCVIVDLDSVAGGGGGSKPKPDATGDAKTAGEAKADPRTAGDTKGGPAAGAISPPTLRWLRFASYFRSDLDPCSKPFVISSQQFFATLPRLRLKLSHLRFGLIFGSLEASEVEATFTGMVVGLCKVADDRPASPAAADEGEAAVASQELQTLQRVGSKEALACSAVAFVHAFDKVAGELVVYAPATTSELVGVNAVVRGDILWEPYSTHGQRVSEGAVTSPLQPYVSPWMLEGLATGARKQTGRRHVPRRKFMKRNQGGGAKAPS
eukprot:TRINITY_DN27568_c0_g1_i1.p1 TRINITY_DN27568_c0_g1~~TRINITY_DN27568_c0_g1_i1.p1  ORF type:complete len:712 (+),score=159.60 TRINITY_DN27568_c0_g1_i1:255-2138(+)